MGITLNTTQSIFIQNSLKRTGNELQKAQERLSTGLKINRASDNPSGSAIAQSFERGIRGMAAAQGNVQQGMAQLETMNDAVTSMIDLVNQYRELAVEAANGTVSNFAPFTSGATAVMTEVTRISDVTEFNGNNLLNGSIASQTLQVGWGTSSANQITLSGIFADSDSTALSLSGITSQATAVTAITNADAAIATLNNRLSSIGNYQGILNNQLNLLESTQANYAAAQSTIRDADVAEESANLTKFQVLQQAGSAMLLQANQMPAIGLSLITG
ncbi:MAG: flagellin [Vampirovibrionales bacterium]|nr:flagellin [Vampirovibrionales bacterium]